MTKKIIFFVDIPYGVFQGDCALTYEQTEEMLNWMHTIDESLKDKTPKYLYTTSMAHLSFDLLDSGFEIYVVKDAKVLQLKPGMDNVHNKDIKKTHNILKLFISGFFDEDFKNGEAWEDFVKNI